MSVANGVTVNAGDVSINRPVLELDKSSLEAYKPREESMTVALEWLNLESTEQGESQLRNQLRDALMTMSPGQRSGFIASLKDLSVATAGTGIGNELDNRLPDVQKEASKGGNIDRLLELLFALMLLMGKANTERSINAAKMGEISIRQAEASGTNGVRSAESNLAGAVSALGLGVATAGIGFSQYAKGTRKHIESINTNGARQHKAQAEVSRATNAAHTSSAQSPSATADTTRHRFDNIKSTSADINDMEINAATPSKVEDARNVHQLGLVHEVTGNISMVSNELALKHTQLQMGGQVVTSFSPFIGRMAESGFGVHGAGKAAEAKVNDAQHDVSSNMQHNEDQSAQRLSELMAKLLSIIVSTAEEGNRHIGELSQAIGQKV